MSHTYSKATATMEKKIRKPRKGRKKATKKPKKAAPPVRVSEETAALIASIGRTVGHCDTALYSDEYLPLLKAINREQVKPRHANTVAKASGKFVSTTLRALTTRGGKRMPSMKYKGLLLAKRHGLVSTNAVEFIVFPAAKRSYVYVVNSQKLHYKHDQAVFLKIQQETQLPADTRKWDPIVLKVWRHALIQGAPNSGRCTGPVSVRSDATLVKLRQANINPSNRQLAREKKMYTTRNDVPIDTSYSYDQ